MKKTSTLAALLLLLAAPAFAQQDKTTDIERKLDALTQEVEQLKLNDTAAPASASNPLAAIRWGGYGEFNALMPSRVDQKGNSSGLTKSLDLRRFVLLGEHDFNERWSLRFELEMEHAGTGQGSETRGEFEVEQAYLDYRATDWLTARAGHVLVPVGWVNLHHEPTAFHGVNRPSVEQLVIPSTWHENGAGLVGRAGIFDYQTYVLSGLKASNAGTPTTDGFSGSAAIGGGKTEGANSPIENLAWAGRVDVRPVAGVVAGGSLYVGRADQGQIGASVPVSLWEAHLLGEWKGLEARGLFAQGRIGNADSLNARLLANDGTFTDFVGRKFFGGYVEAAYNALSLRPRASQYLAPFFRYERYDTQQSVPRGFANNAANSRVEYTVGVTYRPIPQIALKADQQWKRNQARTGVNQWNLGVGWSF